METCDRRRRFRMAPKGGDFLGFRARMICDQWRDQRQVRQEQ
jgi:hypothetical protein